MRIEKNYKYIFLLTFVVVCETLAAQWTQLGDLPNLERDDGVGAVVNNKAYFGTGRKTGGALGSDFYSLDLSAYTWSTIAAMPAGSERQYAAAFSYSNYVFVCGGVNDANTIFSDTYRYNTVTNTWTTVAPKPGTPVFAAFSFTIGDKAYVVSGRSGPTDSELSNEVWEYDMGANVWVQKNNIPFAPQWRGSGASLNNSGYILFGKDAALHYHRELYKYNALGDAWTKAADFPQTKRFYSTMQSSGGQLVIFGGIDSLNTLYNETWFYDETGGFSQGPSLPSSARKGGMSCAIPGKFFYTCGINTSARLKETWLLASLPTGVEEHANSNIFTVHPNPFTDHINISAAKNGQISGIELRNMLGQTIFSTATNNDPLISIDLPQTEKGIYFLVVTSANGNSTVKKLVRE